jgi:hypothetical protein
LKPETLDLQLADDVQELQGHLVLRSWENKCHLFLDKNGEMSIFMGDISIYIYINITNKKGICPDVYNEKYHGIDYGM